ncbi:hypothetical protein ACF08M_35465 [Streptomyces sp. NPDC015032]|uniref:hypothetical protein n=1 Tax=Streptomyces sp. NPDC015032 TaxID=3364937 RepID=UPI0036FBCDAE
MGIESDQLVYDYLSRVGDLAQQQQLSSGTRMRLVSNLRGEIDRQRGTQSADSPAAVRRIIGRLGTPDELVAAAAASADGTAELPPRPEPAAGEGSGIPRPRKGMLRKDSSGKGASRVRASAGGPEETDSPAGPADSAGSADPMDSADPGGPAAPEAATGWMPSPPHMAATPPHMAGTDELGPSGGEPDWWRVEPGPFGDGVDVPGFTGGIEIPAMVRQPSAGDTVPPPRTAPGGPADEDVDAAAGDEPHAEAAGPDEAAPRRRRIRGLLRRAPREAEESGARRGGFSHPLLLVAAALLVAGAVLGSWLALAGGWLLAYSSRTLSRAEAKWAAMGLPGVVVAGGIVWLWGRMEGRWGEPIAQDGLSDAMSGMLPVLVRTAAVASAAFLVWRARRRVG